VPQRAARQTSKPDTQDIGYSQNPETNTTGWTNREKKYRRKTLNEQRKNEEKATK